MTNLFSAAFRVERPIWIACLFVLALTVAIGIMYPATVSVNYYMQQVQIAAFVGILASGAMVVLLLGEIDLSMPWTATATGMLACGVFSSGAAWANDGTAISAALLLGLTIGGLNAFGVAILRAPSMVWTLGVNAILLGLTVVYAGGYSPQTKASPLMRHLAVGRVFDIVPVAALVWMFVGGILVLVLRLTPLGAWIYAMGRSPRVAYLAGIHTRVVVFFAFLWAGLCSAVGGVLLSGYSGQAFQAMGDPMLLPSIAAVVVGGTKVTGGEGRYLGTVVGVLALTLLSNVLSLMQAPEALRLIIYGGTIILMLLVSNRRAQAHQ
ncbi:ABC transporter permease [Rhizobium leguminosarum]|uniref:ABC transporter permease n=1 Tax=Rhizobium leguminosarum TaxID=384 RepID=UPI0015BDB2AB|nr:ABC transporter permease [Rhizobium leguminosarum]MBY5825901.1 ABC transporter permease [Rhizobium leguminosarum]